MKLVKKFILGVILIGVAIQLPFIYRRYQLGQTAEKINPSNAARQVAPDPMFDEYVGVIHAHSSLGGHSTGTFDELIGGASAAGLDFVVITEHWSDSYDTSALTLNGKYGQTLFIAGNEIDTADGDRLLMVPGSADAAGLRHMPTASAISKLHDESRLALVTYPERFKSWDADIDGVEVFSLYTAATGANRLMLLFDMLWSGRAYPELTLGRYFRRPEESLAKFDQASLRRRLGLFAGVDAHSNIGFHVFGDDSGHRWINLKLDPYQASFSTARVHLLLPKGTPLSREMVIDALLNGRFFTGVDAFGDTTGFRFSAGEAVSGDETPLAGVTSLSVSIPVDCRLVIFKDGARFGEAVTSNGRKADFTPDGPGVYRVEAYRYDLGEPFSGMPWIMSNPIYLR